MRAESPGVLSSVGNGDSASFLEASRRAQSLAQELEARERSETERKANAKAERLQSEARLLAVKQQLEEKLKARKDELARAGLHIRELQRELDSAQAELIFTDKEMERVSRQWGDLLSTGHDQHMRRHEELREVLRSAAREAALRELTRLGADQLQKCLLWDADATEATSKALEVNAPSEFCSSLQESAQQYTKMQEKLMQSAEEKLSECKDPS